LLFFSLSLSLSLSLFSLFFSDRVGSRTTFLTSGSVGGVGDSVIYVLHNDQQPLVSREDLFESSLFQDCGGQRTHLKTALCLEGHSAYEMQLRKDKPE
jgi:hypothetical protein